MFMKVPLAQLVQVAQEEKQVHRVQLVNVEKQDLVAPLVLREVQVQLVNQGHQDHKDPQVLQDLLVHLDQGVNLVRQGHVESQALKGHLAALDLQARRGQEAKQDLRGLLVPVGHLDLLDHLDLPDHEANPVLQDPEEILGHQVLLDPLAHVERQGPQGHGVKTDPQDHQVNM